MKSRTVLIFSIIFANVFFSLLFSYNLSEEDIREINSGKPLVKTKKIGNTPWPMVIIKTIVNATPEESVAIFTAYEEHKDYISDLISSKIVKKISKTDVHIAFELNIPWPLSNTKYTTGNRLKKLGKKIYEVEWYFVRSDSSKNNYGKIRFSPYEDRTLLEYQNFSHPKSSLAKFFKSKMIRKTEKTVIAIKKRIETIRASNLVSRYILKLNEKLNSD